MQVAFYNFQTPDDFVADVEREKKCMCMGGGGGVK